jgi:hypothetical protein
MASRKAANRCGRHEELSVAARSAPRRIHALTHRARPPRPRQRHPAAVRATRQGSDPTPRTPRWRTGPLSAGGRIAPPIEFSDRTRSERTPLGRVGPHRTDEHLDRCLPAALELLQELQASGWLRWRCHGATAVRSRRGRRAVGRRGRRGDAGRRAELTSAPPRTDQRTRPSSAGAKALGAEQALRSSLDVTGSCRRGPRSCARGRVGRSEPSAGSAPR